MSNLPDNLQNIVANMTPFQKAYCEYRAKGFAQGVSALKAGSEAADSASRNRVGYQIETMPGVKEYIQWLYGKRQEAQVIDNNSVISMIQKVYDEAMKSDKLREANSALELLAKVLGMTNPKTSGIPVVKEPNSEEKVNTGAFRDEGDDLPQSKVDERYSQLQQMLKDLNAK